MRRGSLARADRRWPRRRRQHRHDAVRGNRRRRPHLHGPGRPMPRARRPRLHGPGRATPRAGHPCLHGPDCATPRARHPCLHGPDRPSPSARHPRRRHEPHPGERHRHPAHRPQRHGPCPSAVVQESRTASAAPSWHREKGAGARGHQGQLAQRAPARSPDRADPSVDTRSGVRALRRSVTTYAQLNRTRCDSASALLRYAAPRRRRVATAEPARVIRQSGSLPSTRATVNRAVPLGMSSLA